jgi:hypothetical protein
MVGASSIDATRRRPRSRIWSLMHSLRPDARARSAVAECRWQQEWAAQNVEIGVCDEGVVHEVWRQLYRNPGLLARNWWVRELERTKQQVVVIHVSPRVALSRIASKQYRGPINQQLLAAGDIDRAEWTSAIASYFAILAVLRRLGAIVIETDDMSFEDVVCEVERLSRRQ